MALSQRGWTLGGAGVAVALVGLTYLVGVAPELSSASSLNTQTDAARQANTLLALKNHRLQVESATMPALKLQSAAQLVALPSDTGVPALTRDLSNSAAAHALKLTSLAASAPTEVGAAAAAAHVAGGSPIGKQFQIPVSLTLTGSMSNQLGFLHQLQTAESRAVLVSSVQLSTAQSVVTMTLALKVFLAPQATTK